MAKKRDLMAALEKHKSTGNNEFFTLADDGDTAIVRFLYRSMDELDWFVVHEVEIGGKKRWVECSEEDNCPLCLKVGRPSLKLFIQLMQKGREDVVMTWERGQKFIPIIQDLFEQHGDLTQHLFEVVRQGKRGDSNTRYLVHHLGASQIGEDEILERQEFLGPEGFILQKTHEEMEAILAGNYQYTKVDNPTPRNAPATSTGGGTVGTSAKKDVEVF